MWLGRDLSVGDELKLFYISLWVLIMLLPSSRPQLLREVYSSGTLVFDPPARTWEAKLNFQILFRSGTTNTS